MDAQPCQGLVLNAPKFFVNPDFRRWLENDRPKFTLHMGGKVGEWSDVVVLIDPSLSGEGSDSDMPTQIWDQILDICRTYFGVSRNRQCHYMVRLTNLPA